MFRVPPSLPTRTTPRPSHGINLTVDGLGDLDLIEATSPIDKAARVGRTVLVEKERFLRDCLFRGIGEGLNSPVETFESVSLLCASTERLRISLVLLSWISASSLADGMLQELREVRMSLPDARLIVLANQRDLGIARAAITTGAHGYLPMNVGLSVAIKAMQFVLAGGTYAPPEILFALASQPPQSTASVITPNELLVVRKVQEGKPNKAIASELDVCENLIKIQLRQIMKKFNVRNRTELAVKATEMLSVK